MLLVVSNEVAPFAGAVIVAGMNTVMMPLVASSVYVSFEKKRISYVPGTVGMTNDTGALVTPLAGGVCRPFRYLRCKYAFAGAPVA